MSHTKFYTNDLEKLIGGKILGVVISPERMGEPEYFGLRIQMPEPDSHIKILWFLSDDEGNGPGSFDIQIMPKNWEKDNG